MRDVQCTEDRRRCTVSPFQIDGFRLTKRAGTCCVFSDDDHRC